MTPPTQLLLASASPRRAQLLRDLGYDFEIRPSHVDEVLPQGVSPEGAARYLAELKAMACAPWLTPSLVILTADSVVIHREDVLNKPTDLNEARAMLRRLCGDTHTVVTGVCLLSFRTGSVHREVFDVSTQVTLGPADERELDYYLTTQPPLDKAGSYGIQDWIGLAKATRVVGSYTNVMGLPTAEVYTALLALGLRPQQ